MKSSNIGGQAVLEGIMMKNRDRYAVAVRKPDGEIFVQTEEFHSVTGRYKKLTTIPFVRGVFNFIDSMVLGIKTLTFSASFYEEEEEKNKTSISSIRKDLERELEKLKAERIRQYEAYAEGVTGREEYLSEKKALSEKIEKMQTRYEQLQSITTEEDALMEDIKKVRENAEEVNILKKMTRQVAEEFVEEIIIYDSKQMEIKFAFDDLLTEIANRVSKKKTEEIA